MKALLTDIVVVGTVMFLVGTWLSSHHSHKMITDDHPEHKIREFLIYTCIGIALITVGSNMMTDGLIEKLTVKAKDQTPFSNGLIRLHLNNLYRLFRPK